ncbi:hypothetical protein B0J11DRAFT_536800 [Dendryphion nanum]|uniref:Uncharacterized protein n=1 Tax=Dendryphion nanum TaxID=256645 RepID=A0A9P9DCA9_9PLEO|nr:hypothetical protein B0J11DRAFT_536800 [Dendryphion nanum]
MAFHLAAMRSRKFALKSVICIFCQSHQVAWRQFTSTSFHRSAFSPSPVRCAVGARRGDISKFGRSPEAVRAELDAIARKSFYLQCHTAGLISMTYQEADDIVAEFLAARKRGPGQNVATDIATKYDLEVSDITKLAIATFRIPGKSDPSGYVPPSEHDEIAKEILLSCSRAYDSDATIEILNSVYWGPSLVAARKIACKFSAVETKESRGYLEALAKNEDTSAMTLLGIILEKEGNKRRARELYEAALRLQESIKFDPSKVHQLSLPRITPWNALGMLLLSDKNPKSQEQAKEVFKRGALEGEDPFSYFHLASFEEKSSGPWLQYMSKAAASGHSEAMLNVGLFYVNAASDGTQMIKPEYLEDSILSKALKWLTESPRYDPENVGIEWLQLAAQANYKPAMWELAQIWEAQGNREMVIKYLRGIVASPPKGTPEKWPELVDDANRSLTNATRKTLF